VGSCKRPIRCRADNRKRPLSAAGLLAMHVEHSPRSAYTVPIRKPEKSSSNPRRSKPHKAAAPLAVRRPIAPSAIRAVGAEIG
jgi:hypothetical protein